MAGRLTGGCLCGAVRYDVRAEPMQMLNCHCRDCQRASGTGFAAIVVVPRSAAAITGELRFHETKSDSGNGIARGFCPVCGSPVAINLERMPDIIGLHASSLDDPSIYRPQIEVFTESAQPWDMMSRATKKYPRGMTR